MPPLRENPSTRAIIRDINSSIQSELQSIANKAINVFQPVGAFLFVLDPYSHLLEPLFESHHFPYEMLGAVASSYAKESENPPAPIDNAGIASVAYLEGDAYSQDPMNDKRFGSDARNLHEAYQITGSMMAVRLDDLLGNVLAVVVVHSQEMTLGLSPQQETHVISRLRDALIPLRSMLQARREVAARNDLECCQHFVTALATSATVPRTVARACSVFAETCVPLFGADALYVRIGRPGSRADWFPALSPDQTVVANVLADHLPSNEEFTLNRARQSPALAEQLENAFGGRFVWSRVKSHASGYSATCIVRRKAASVLDHWQTGDNILLQQATNLLTAQVARSFHFEDLLNTIPAVAGSDDKQARFKLLVQLVRDYFGFDQILLAKVKRKPDRYKICTQFVDGFGPNEGVTKERHKYFVPGQPTYGRLDIMEQIVSDFEGGSLRDVYAEDASSPRLDQQIVSACSLIGEHYFIPCCCSSDGVGTPIILHSILHVGSSSGSIRLEQDSVPLMLTFAGRIAEWLETERMRDCAVATGSIRAIEVCSLDSLRQIACEVATVTASIGCTVFIHSECLPLIGMRQIDSDRLSEAMVMFVSNVEVWPELLGEGRAHRIIDMFASFFGITSADCLSLLTHVGFEHCAAIAASALYVRAAQSNASEVVESLESIVLHRPRMPLAEFTQLFGRFLFENCYFPGYGLTGWVLRHGHSMCLPDKSAVAIDRFYKSLPAYLDTPWNKTVLAALRCLHDGATALETGNWICPTHADHVSEDLERQSPDSAYIAFPIEGIDAIGRPAGVIRVSCSHRVNRRYSREDTATVAEAARHVSVLLRRTYMRDTAYVAKYVRHRGEQSDLSHFLANLREGVEKLRGALLPKSSGNPVQTATIKETVEAIQSSVDSAFAKTSHDNLALRIRDAPVSNWSIPSTIAEYLAEWLKAAVLSVEILFTETNATQIPSGEFVTLSFRVIHELIRNFKKHQRVDAAILITCDGVPSLYVGDIATLSRVGSVMEWRHYLTVARRPHRGGTRLIMEATKIEPTLAVEVGYIESGVKRAMIGRVRYKP